MDYKKLLKNRKTREAILRCLSFVPDEPMLKLQYRIKMGRSLDLQHPQRFTEKLQWYKLHYKNPEMVRCADKFDVRAYVQEKGLGAILNPCIGVYNRAEDVDFSVFPEKFVLKDTLGGGGNAVIVCKNRAQFDPEACRAQMRSWVRIPRRRDGGREWPYYNGKPHRIIAEAFIESDPAEGGLIDYKFFCFNGKVEFLYVMSDRELGSQVSVGIFDRDYKRLPCQRKGDPPLTRDIPRPRELEEMIRISEILASDFPHARIDLYNVNHQIIFGEITFYNASGYMEYDPDGFDFEIGEKFPLKTFDR